jgi:positive regulator of sigma E activity
MHGCRLWFGLLPGRKLRGSAAQSERAAGQFLRLGLRAFALPLALFAATLALFARLQITQDWLAVAALVVAALCGWYALRRHSRRHG